METKSKIIEFNKGVNSPTIDAEHSISLDDKEPSLYIFFSLDICDSTSMKDQVNNWKEIILQLYDTQEEFKDIMRVWKYIGDEVVFCTAFSGIDSLVKLIDQAYKKLKAVENKLTEAANNSYKVSVKGTMWLAYISGKSSHTGRVSNIDEFLGKHIDEGFRMTGFSSNGKLLLDPKIVFILLLLFSIDKSKISSRYSGSLTLDQRFADKFLSSIQSLIADYTDKEKAIITRIRPLFELRSKICDLIYHIFFIKYEKLKGIWKNYPYPIYWYSTSESNNVYPNINNNELLPIITDQMYPSKYYSIELMSVFNQAGVKSDIDDILGIVSNNIPSRPYLKNDTVQLYYSIACVKDNKVFIAKRCSDRKHLRGVWEFGFQKHTLTHTCDDIQSFFLFEFGLNVKPITDGSIDNNLIPLHFCTTYRNTNKHNSILCCAVIQNEGSIEEIKAQVENHLQSIQQSGKEVRYSEVDFIGVQDAKDKFEDLTLKDVYEDAYNVSTGNTHVFNDSQNHTNELVKQKAIVYFTDSVKYVLDFYERWSKLNTKKWYNLFSDEGDD